MNFLIILNQIVLPLLLIVSKYYVNCDRIKLYDNLIQCYRNDSTMPWITNSLQVLLELIRKIEDANPTSIDIRYLSVNLIHQLRIDGIQKAFDAKETEYLIPYNPNGIQTAKFSILLKLISDVPSTLNFNNILSHSELCTLHKLISSTIESNIRGDEHKTCKNPLYDVNSIPSDKIFVFSERNKPYVVSQRVSKCPEEKGIIRTYNFGTFSPGIVIASIAAGLQPQLVQLREIFPTLELPKDHFEHLETMDKRDIDKKIRKLLRSSDSIDNTYASNLAGDLAEVCVYQTPYYRKNVTIGVNGYWNDTDYPIVRYINEQNALNWCMTDSEILGGIDGIHLAKYINHWVNRIHRMKLSQILEMYYSSRGILNLSTENLNRKKKFDNKLQYSMAIQDLNPLNDDYQPNNNNNGQSGYYDSDRYGDSACERKNILNRIPKEKLKDETFFLAQLLQHSTNTITIDDDLLKSSCYAAVEKFYDYSQKLLQQLPKCKTIRRPIIDLTLIIDGSRTKFDNLKLISFIMELIDVSTYSSRISVIHGGNGQYMVKPTHSIVNAFDQLKNFTGSFPQSLSLTESFTSIIHYSENLKRNGNIDSISGLSQVILVVSQTQQIRADDFKSAKRLIDGSFQSNVDLYFTFLTNNVKSFLDLTIDADKIPMTPNERYTIIKSTELNPKRLQNDLLRSMRPIPKWLNLPSCSDLNVNKRQPGDIEMNHYNDIYEDYVSRDHANYYRINGKHLRQHSTLRIQFQGVGYGVITVCKEIPTQPTECLSTQNLDDEIIWFNVTNVCDSNVCLMINFKVELDSSNVKCTENSCRYPDNVRYYIKILNEQCGNGAAFMNYCNHFYLLFAILLITIFNVQWCPFERVPISF